MNKLYLAGNVFEFMRLFRIGALFLAVVLVLVDSVGLLD